MIQAFGTTAEFERRAVPGREARQVRVAVLVPCYNEGSTIGSVVSGFRAVLPDAAIYVYDNNSSDDTVKQAEAAGAIMRRTTCPLP